MSALEPIDIWGHSGPNPPKVAMIAEELGIPYKIHPISLDKVKEPKFLKINPNGRVPAICDPNTDLTLWESGAIVEYLVEKYDTNHKLSYVRESSEAYHSKQWLHFQVSGQGFYYGQAAWFKRYHPEHVQSALDRYLTEMKRVTSVLDGHLKIQRKTHGGDPWLVGDRITYADIAFVTYQHFLPRILEEELGRFELVQFVEVRDWIARMTARPAIKKILEGLPQ